MRGPIPDLKGIESEKIGLRQPLRLDPERDDQAGFGERPEKGFRDAIPCLRLLVSFRAQIQEAHETE